VLYVISDVFSVRNEPTAEASFAAMRERSRLGIAIAAIIRMIATTINSSMSEKPLDFRKFQPSRVRSGFYVANRLPVADSMQLLKNQAEAPLLPGENDTICQVFLTWAAKRY
jgi:hypothetical protein